MATASSVCQQKTRAKLKVLFKKYQQDDDGINSMRKIYIYNPILEKSI